MSNRWRRVALAVSLVALAGCSDSREGRAQRDPSSSETPRASAATGTPTASPAGTSSEPSAPVPPATTDPATLRLVYQRDNAVYALPLAGAAARPTKLLDVRGDVRFDQRGRYLAVHERRAVTIVELRTRRVVASVANGEAAAFGADDTALVTVRPTAPAHEHDCHRPTRLVTVDLRTGDQRTVRDLDDQFVPEAVLGDMVVGSVTIDAECETPAAALLRLAAGEPQRVGDGASVVRSVSATGDRVWLHRYPDSAHPRGHHLVVDDAGRELARLSYSGNAAFGPGNMVVYTETVYGKPGTDDFYFPQDTKLRVADGLPSTSDRSVSLPEQNGDVVWGVEADTFALRAETPDDPKTEFRAMACTVRLACRPLNLTWYDEVTLLGVVPASRVE